MKKAQSLQFTGTFDVERDGNSLSVTTLKPGDKITGYSDTDAYDGNYDPGECKQFAKIIAYEAAGNKDLPVNKCINGSCGGYYDNFSKDTVNSIK